MFPFAAMAASHFLTFGVLAEPWKPVTTLVPGLHRGYRSLLWHPG